jgi:hypothetical protein
VGSILNNITSAYLEEFRVIRMIAHFGCLPAHFEVNHDMKVYTSAREQEHVHVHVQVGSSNPNGLD